MYLILETLKEAYLSNSAVVLRWNLDFSSFMTEESTSSPFANSTFPRCRIAATTIKIASWKNFYYQTECNTTHYILTYTSRNTNLLFLTDSNYIHSPSGCKIFLAIIYSIQLIATGLIQVMELFRVSQLKLLSLLKMF